jgi:hypothetical protein
MILRDRSYSWVLYQILSTFLLLLLLNMVASLEMEIFFSFVFDTLIWFVFYLFPFVHDRKSQFAPSRYY